LICLSFGLVFQSCERAEELVAPEVELQEALPNVKRWYAQKTKNYDKSTTTEAIFMPQWGEGLLHTLADGTRLAVFPVWRELAVRYYEVGFVRRLAVRLSPDNQVIDGSMLEIIGEMDYLRENHQTIQIKYFEKRLSDLSGGVGILETPVRPDDLKNEKGCTAAWNVSFNSFSCTFIYTNACGGYAAIQGNCIGGFTKPTTKIYDGVSSGEGGGGGEGSGGGSSPLPAPIDKGENLGLPISQRFKFYDASPSNNESQIQEPINTPFRSIFINGTLYLLKISPAERDVFKKKHFIFHYAGHGADVEEENEYGPMKIRLSDGTRPPFLLLNTDQAVDDLVNGSGGSALRDLPKLPHSTQEAQWINYINNYKFIYKPAGGPIVTTDHTIMLSMSEINGLKILESVKDRIIIDQADAWARHLNIKTLYEQAADDVKKTIVLQAEAIIKQRDTSIQAPPGKRGITSDKNGLLPQWVLDELNKRKQEGDFRQAVVVDGDTGILTW
jgi:hypothetical protein